MIPSLFHPWNKKPALRDMWTLTLQHLHGPLWNFIYSRWGHGERLSTTTRVKESQHRTWPAAIIGPAVAGCQPHLGLLHKYHKGWNKTWVHLSDPVLLKLLCPAVKHAITVSVHSVQHYSPTSLSQIPSRPSQRQLVLKISRKTWSCWWTSARNTKLSITWKLSNRSKRF